MIHEKESKEYLNFLKKFEVKKTTDDCFTPPHLYNAVYQYVMNNCNIEGLKVVRPFYPGGDYTKVDYTNSVVIDNPPFSLFSKIIRFYVKNKIPFFLFAPNLTMLATANRINCTILPVDYSVTYDNGASVNTGFVSNMFGNKRIILDPKLSDAIKNADKKTKEENNPKNQKYIYPDCLFTTSRVGKIMEGLSEPLVIYDSEVHYVASLESQRIAKKSIFGGGYLLGKNATKRIIEARKRAEEARKRAEEARATRWPLSKEEKGIIKKLK